MTGENVEAVMVDGEEEKELVAANTV